MLKHLAIIVAAALIGSPASAGSFAECILDKLPGSSNHATHGAVHQACAKQYPRGFTVINKGAGRGLFGYSDGNACVMKKAKDTNYGQSAMLIAYACRCLYDKEQFQDQKCAYPK